MKEPPANNCEAMVPAGADNMYTSLSFGKRLEDEGLVPSMGRAGSAHDNALAESFVATLKTELLYRSSWPTRQVARTAFLQSTSRASTTPEGGTLL